VGAGMARRTFSYPISLAIVVAMLIAITGGFIAWWNYRTGVDNVRQLAGRLFDRIADDTKTRTEAFLERAMTAATGLDVADLYPFDETTSVKAFVKVLEADPNLKWVSYSHQDGEFRGVYRERVGDRWEYRYNHSKIVDGNTVLDEFRLDGEVWVLIKHEDDTKYDPRERPFYKLAVAAGGGGVWTPPYVFAEKVPGITYAFTKRRDGQIAGVYTLDYDLAQLSELTRQLKFSEHGTVAITTGDGILLAHPTSPVVINDQLVKASNLPHREGDLERVVYLDTTHWNIVVRAPESDFDAAMRERVVASLLISAIAVLIAVGVAWLLARRVSGPLTTLSDEMVKVGGLHLDDTSEPAPSMFREIDMMNTALAKMKGGLRSFSRYVPRDLVRTLLSSGHTADLSGEVRELTIYFSDLAGFTSLSETRAPDELVHFLSEYFDDMSTIIMREQGTVDKYMGDGIMAFWGAPIDVKDHAARACAAALRCQRRVRELSARGVPLGTRIGLATGKVLVGNIGSTERINYTVMGDTANLASRLEGLNKQYGTDSMISEATYEQAREHVVARPIDVVAVKGKKRGVRVFELLALVTDNDTEAVAIAAAATRALAAYLERRFDDAIAVWDEILATRPDDRPSQIMRARALQHAASPPPADWDGVSYATEK
jgi:adenylate cyclase